MRAEKWPPSRLSRSWIWNSMALHSSSFFSSRISCSVRVSSSRMVSISFFFNTTDSSISTFTSASQPTRFACTCSSPPMSIVKHTRISFCTPSYTGRSYAFTMPIFELYFTLLLLPW